MEVLIFLLWLCTCVLIKAPDDEADKAEDEESPMMETVRSKCITQLLLLGAIDSIQVCSFHCICDLRSESVHFLTDVGLDPVCDTIRSSQISSGK
jgi:hypothetical protein